MNKQKSSGSAKTSNELPRRLRTRLHYSLACACLVPLSACTFLGIVVTSNPDKKLQDAQELQNYGRPHMAEYQIMKAMDIYQRDNDVRGLGNAYRMYAELIESPRYGFVNKSITVDNRFAKAKEFSEKALENYKIVVKMYGEGRYDVLTNIYHSLAVANLALDQRNEACTDFDLALEAYNQNMKQNPSAKPNYPHAYSSLPDALADMKRRAGCPHQGETISGLAPN
jgi:tetratricopeptide (TPR) repeat protein